jgi:hypothetical protein
MHRAAARTVTKIARRNQIPRLKIGFHSLDAATTNCHLFFSENE